MGATVVLELLVVLMALAGNEHHVAGTSLGDSHINGGGALQDDIHPCGGIDRDAGADVVGDVGRILVAGIVRALVTDRKLGGDNR